MYTTIYFVLFIRADDGIALHCSVHNLKTTGSVNISNCDYLLRHENLEAGADIHLK